MAFLQASVRMHAGWFLSLVMLLYAAFSSLSKDLCMRCASEPSFPQLPDPILGTQPRCFRRMAFPTALKAGPGESQRCRLRGLVRVVLPSMTQLAAAFQKTRLSSAFGLQGVTGDQLGHVCGPLSSHSTELRILAAKSRQANCFMLLGYSQTWRRQHGRVRIAGEALIRV